MNLLGLPNRLFRKSSRKVRPGKGGEWVDSGMMQVQYKGIKGNDLEQFRGMDTQTVVAPSKAATGEAVVPFEKLR